MKRGALRGALTDASTSGKLAVVRGLSFDEPKTKRAADLLEALGLQGKILIVLDQPSSTGAPEKSFRNMPHVRLTYAGALGTYDVIAADRILLTEEALDALTAARTKGAVPEPGSVSTGDRPQPEESVAPEDQEVGE
jgi:large subunit ribosomal protein L4